MYYDGCSITPLVPVEILMNPVQISILILSFHLRLGLASDEIPKICHQITEHGGCVLLQLTV
jgi:hypothetical protein